MDGGDDVPVLWRQFEMPEFPDAVPWGWTDDDGAFGITLADDRQRRPPVFVPGLVRELGGRFVEDFKQHRVGPAFAVFGEGRPRLEKLLSLAGWVGRNRQIVVEIEDHHQLVGQRVVHRPVQRFEKLLSQFAAGVGFAVAQRMEVDADVVEAGFPNQLEMGFLKLAARRVLPDHIPAQQVHPAPQTGILLENITGRKRRRTKGYEANSHHRRCEADEAMPIQHESHSGIDSNCAILFKRPVDAGQAPAPRAGVPALIPCCHVNQD